MDQKADTSFCANSLSSHAHYTSFVEWSSRSALRGSKKASHQLNAKAPSYGANTPSLIPSLRAS